MIQFPTVDGNDPFGGFDAEAVQSAVLLATVCAAAGQQLEGNGVRTRDVAGADGSPDTVGPTELVPSNTADPQSAARNAAGIELDRVNGNWPNMVIQPFPSRAISVTVDNVTPQDINVPQGAFAVRFTCSKQRDFWCSRLGRADAGSMSGNDAIGSVFNPDLLEWIDCRGITQFSVVGDAAGNTKVSAQFLIQV